MLLAVPAEAGFVTAEDSPAVLAGGPALAAGAAAPSAGGALVSVLRSPAPALVSEELLLSVL